MGLWVAPTSSRVLCRRFQGLGLSLAKIPGLTAFALFYRPLGATIGSRFTRLLPWISGDSFQVHITLLLFLGRHSVAAFRAWVCCWRKYQASRPSLYPIAPLG